MEWDQYKNTIWTVGHSTRPIGEFIKLIHLSDVEIVADIRRYPGSRKYPQYNKEALEKSLSDAGIKYIHLPDLGGRRKPLPDSINKGWRLPSFRGYADYMATDAFRNALEYLECIARKERTVYMCSEAVWWRCHRALVSDFLKLRDWTVIHIMSAGKSEEHPYTQPARVAEGKLLYDQE